METAIRHLALYLNRPCERQYTCCGETQSLMNLDYDELNAVFLDAKLGVEAAECHGFICGYFCASNALDMELLQEHLIGVPEDAGAIDISRRVLDTIASDVASDLLSDEISFNLLLPADGRAMHERSTALSEWCGAFISGLGIGRYGDRSDDNEHCEEFIKDVAAMSKLETTLEEDEETESALFELVEYIRVGVIMLYQEWHPHAGSNQRPEVLH